MLLLSSNAIFNRDLNLVSRERRKIGGLFLETAPAVAFQNLKVEHKLCTEMDKIFKKWLESSNFSFSPDQKWKISKKEK